MNFWMIVGAAGIYLISRKKSVPAPAARVVEAEKVVTYPSTAAAIVAQDPVPQAPEPKPEPVTAVIEPKPIIPVVPPTPPPPPVVQPPIAPPVVAAPTEWYGKRYWGDDFNQAAIRLNDAWMDYKGMLKNIYGEVIITSNALENFKNEQANVSKIGQLIVEQALKTLNEQYLTDIAKEVKYASGDLIAEYRAKAAAALERAKNPGRVYIRGGMSTINYSGQVDDYREMTKYELRAKLLADRLGTSYSSVLDTVESSPIASPTPPVTEPIQRLPGSESPPLVGTYISQAKLPTSYPSLSQFPAPSSVSPMPMLVWSTEQGAWVSNVVGASTTVLMNWEGKTYKVSEKAPLLATISNGAVSVSPNQVYSLSVGTRTGDGQIVY